MSSEPEANSFPELSHSMELTWKETTMSMQGKDKGPLPGAGNDVLGETGPGLQCR